MLDNNGHIDPADVRAPFERCQVAECRAELQGPEEGFTTLDERQHGYCADCLDNLRSKDLEDQLSELLGVVV